jgi:acetolactate synthase-1/3 small subunit
MEKKYCLSLLVENNFGVLSRIAGLFSRRGYNIDSLTVGTTQDTHVSRMTITVMGDEKILEQITKQLNKLVDVIKVIELKGDSSISREIVFIKVKACNGNRTEIIEIANIFRAKIVDVAPETLILELTGDDNKISAFFTMLEPFGILEFIRSGATGLQRGDKVLK